MGVKIKIQPNITMYIKKNSSYINDFNINTKATQTTAKIIGEYLTNF